VVGRPNDRGTFVLRGGVPNGEVEHFLWNGRGQFEPLPMPPAGRRFQANGLNHHEVAVGTMYTVAQWYAATWSRRDGYTLLPQPWSALASMGDLIDARGRVYGQTIAPVEDTSCPYWRSGTHAQTPTVWNGRESDGAREHWGADRASGSNWSSEPGPTEPTTTGAGVEAACGSHSRNVVCQLPDTLTVRARQRASLPRKQIYGRPPTASAGLRQAIN
jgi:hypothetical protein